MESSDKLDDGYVSPDLQARRRQLHTEAEQRRRDAIKKGFDNLMELIHPVKAGSGSSLLRMSKATVLNRSISMIGKLANIKSQKLMEIERLEKEVKTLKILNTSYERISNAYSYSTDTSMGVVTEKIKLQLFQMFMESLFQSFDEIVSESELTELSEQIITWLESNCKPEHLRATMESLMNKLFVNEPNFSQSFEGPIHSTQTSLYQSIAGSQFDHSKPSPSSGSNYNSFSENHDSNVRINPRDLQSIFSPGTFGTSHTPDLPRDAPQYNLSFPRPEFESGLSQMDSSSSTSPKQSFAFSNPSNNNSLSQHYRNNLFLISGENPGSSTVFCKTANYPSQSDMSSELQSGNRKFHRQNISSLNPGRDRDSRNNLIGHLTDST